MIKHGPVDVMHAVTSDGLVGETYEPLLGAIGQLLQACTEEAASALVMIPTTCC